MCHFEHDSLSELDVWLQQRSAADWRCYPTARYTSPIQVNRFTCSAYSRSGRHVVNTGDQVHLQCLFTARYTWSIQVTMFTCSACSRRGTHGQYRWPGSPAVLVHSPILQPVWSSAAVAQGPTARGRTGQLQLRKYCCQTPTRIKTEKNIIEEQLLTRN